jgi:hypothetical protein
VELLNILTQYRVIKEALEAGEYLGAWEATLPVQQSMITLGRNIGFKAGPDDERLTGEIAACAEECVDLCKKAPKKAAVGASFDWRTALQEILMALFKAWNPK